MYLFFIYEISGLVSILHEVNSLICAGFSEDLQCGPRENSHHKQNRFVPLSEGVTACATHPLNSTIVAGTKVGSLEFWLSQRIYTHTYGSVIFIYSRPFYRHEPCALSMA